MLIPLTRPVFGREESQAIGEVLASAQVAQGPAVRAFEKDYADVFGAVSAVAVSSGTAALHLSLVAAGVRRGHEVVVPSLSGIAAANAVRYVGACAVFADVDRTTHTLGPETIAPAVTPRTKAVIAVHHAGLPADVDAIHELCDPLGIEVIEDAACALGSTYRGTTVGGHSAFVTTSLGPDNVITTGEGGVVGVRDPDVASRLRRLRSHAASPIPETAVIDLGTTVPSRHRELGWSYRLSDIQGALGRVQLQRLPLLLHRRRYLAERYRDVLAGELGLVAADDPAYGTTNFHSFWVWISSDSPVSRDELVRVLRAHGITSRPGFVVAHRELAYRGHPHAPLPVSEHVARSTLVLPLFHDLEEHDVDRIADVIADTIRQPATGVLKGT